MDKEIRCPHCNSDLKGRDTIVRDVRLKDNDWLGIENGRIINCNLSMSQPDFGYMQCFTCGEEIEDYIMELIENDLLNEGDL